MDKYIERQLNAGKQVLDDLESNIINLEGII